MPPVTKREKDLPFIKGDRVRVIKRVSINQGKIDERSKMFWDSFNKVGRINLILKSSIIGDYEIYVRFDHLSNEQSRALWFIEDELALETKKDRKVRTRRFKRNGTLKSRAKSKI